MTRVFVNGTFDILHPGHIKLLQRAKELGTVLVAVDSDPMVRELKGPLRPVNTQHNRMLMLNSLKYTDYVVGFDTQEELKQIILEWQPHIMVKGADYIGKPIVGSDLVNEIVFISLTNDSTTKTIKSIGNR